MNETKPPNPAAKDKAAPRDAQPMFTRKYSAPKGDVTSERIAADLAAFREAGGKVEVLGVTHTLKKLDGAPTQAATTPARPPSGARRGARS